MLDDGTILFVFSPFLPAIVPSKGTQAGRAFLIASSVIPQPALTLAT